MKKYRTWHEVLVEQLTSRDEALDYLQFALEEYQVNGDKPFFLRALRTVFEAQGEIVKKIGVVPETLSEVLSSDESPSIDALVTILNAFGWRLSIEPIAGAYPDLEVSGNKEVDLNASTEKIAESVVEVPPS